MHLFIFGEINPNYKLNMLYMYSITNASTICFSELLCPNIVATLLTILIAEYCVKNFARFGKAVS